MKSPLSLLLEHVERRHRGEDLGLEPEDTLDAAYLRALDAWLGLAELRQDRTYLIRIYSTKPVMAGVVEPPALEKISSARPTWGESPIETIVRSGLMPRGGPIDEDDS